MFSIKYILRLNLKKKKKSIVVILVFIVHVFFGLFFITSNKKVMRSHPLTPSETLMDT